MPFIASDTPTPVTPQLPAGRAFSVLVVEDQASVRAALVAELQHAGVSDILEAAEGQAALHLFKTRRPDLVLLDIKLPGQDGYWVAQQMRESEPGDWTPIIFLSGLDSELDVWRGIEVGGDDYLVKPVKPIVLMAKLRAMRRLRDMRQRLVAMSAELHLANQRLNAMVEVDALTGLVNRRGFDRILHSEILAARRDGTPLTLMLCDLDHFKLFNDASGHVQGDACLKEVGRLLREICVPGMITSSQSCTQSGRRALRLCMRDAAVLAATRALRCVASREKKSRNLNCAIAPRCPSASQS